MWPGESQSARREGPLDGRPVRKGSAVAASVAPVAPTRLASVYVEDAEGVAQALGLRAAEAGANVVLLQPEDDSLLERADARDGLRKARLPLVVADLLSGPVRSPAEAEALMDWMTAAPALESC